jgi:hypothetical chaperone protein
MIIGMDFGTTNSGMAVYDGRAVNVLPLDPSNRNPRVARTALYITNDHSLTIGRGAVDQYFAQNIGRAVKMQKVWLGELEVYGADMYYVTDAYAWIDVYSPGRLFLSIKTGLRNADYAGTVVGQYYYALEDLISLYMSITKIRAEQQLGQELRQVVLGRPVHFATDTEHDNLAQARLLQAAFRAGYEKVYLQYEPIAAAFSYETEIDHEQNVLVFDFGGGTLDVTVMRLGDPKRRQVLSTGGVPVAGDVFDQKIVQTKLTRHFGKGSEYGPRHKAMTVPQWIYDYFSDWQTILELQTAENKRLIHDIAQSARRRWQIEALERLVSSNYGLKMFDIVEQAKRRISEKHGAEILLEGPGFKVREFITRSEFEGIIRNEIVTIDQHVDEVVAQSGLKPAEIDVVIRTGGSAQIAAFYEMLCRKFGETKVRSLDTFSSVTSGLGIIGQGIEAGEIDLPAYTPDKLAYTAPDMPHSRPNVSPINLDIMQRRIAVAEGAVAAGVTDADLGLVLVDEEGVVTAVPLESSRLQQADPIPLPGSATDLQIARLDDQLLLITSKYRFLLISPRQLLELQDMELAITNLHQFEQNEKIVNLSNWTRLKSQQRLLLVTSTGYARPYPLDVLVPSIEAPVPLKFDQPLPGVVVAVRGLNGNEGELVLVTRTGKAARFAQSVLRTSGVQLLNLGTVLEDRVNGVTLAQPDDELLVVTADGYGRFLLTTQIDAPDKLNAKPKSIIARRSDVVGIGREGDRVATSLWLTRLNDVQIPRDNATKTYPLLALQENETIRSLGTNLNNSPIG